MSKTSKLPSLALRTAAFLKRMAKRKRSNHCKIIYSESPETKKGRLLTTIGDRYMRRSKADAKLTLWKRTQKKG